jgi:hypothetical protein
MQLTMSRPKSKMQNKESPWRLNLRMHLTMPRPKFKKGISTLEVEFLDGIDNVKAKIQHKELLPWRLNPQMQLIMLRPKSKTRNHLGDGIID